MFVSPFFSLLLYSCHQIINLKIILSDSSNQRIIRKLTRTSPHRYQATLDELKAKGRCQIERYTATTPDIGAVIERQLSNVQESYNSLLYTAQQIRGRLCDSLAKFQQYEDTLESIMGSLDECEPLVTCSVEDNLSLALAQGQLEQARVSITYKLGS